jgi:phosphoribosylpyrophosphate synthetase
LSVERIVTTDSVAQRSSALSVEVKSLGPLLADAIRRLRGDD